MPFQSLGSHLLSTFLNQALAPGQCGPADERRQHGPVDPPEFHTTAYAAGGPTAVTYMRIYFTIMRHGGTENVLVFPI